MAGSVADVIDAARGDLVLQIRGANREGHIVRIRSRKCTVGSGPRCTLRLHARGVRPLHCLIVRGSRTTLIRRWARDTRLNGRAFTDAELVPGDRLAVGPIELSVVETAGWADLQPGGAPQAAGPSPAPGPAQTRRPHPPSVRPPGAAQQARKRARRLLEQLRRARHEIARLQEQREQWETQRADRQRRLDEQSKELDLRQTELEAAEEAFRRQREQPDTRGAATDPAGELQRSEEQNNEAPRQMGASQTGAPVDTAEVLQQMGVAPLVAGDEPDDEPQPVTEPPAGEFSPASEPSKEESEPSKEEDDSINDYMARLLDRVRGVAGVARPKPTVLTRPEPVAGPAEELLSQPQSEAPRPRPGGKRRGPVDLSPRAVAPEKSADLSAMRALANDSAQSAIDRHARQKIVSAIRARLLVTILGLVVGSFATWMWCARGAPVAFLYVAMALFAAAGFCAGQYLVMTGRLITRRSPKPRPVAVDEDPSGEA